MVGTPLAFWAGKMPVLLESGRLGEAALPGKAKLRERGWGAHRQEHKSDSEVPVGPEPLLFRIPASRSSSSPDGRTRLGRGALNGIADALNVFAGATHGVAAGAGQSQQQQRKGSNQYSPGHADPFFQHWIREGYCFGWFGRRWRYPRPRHEPYGIRSPQKRAPPRQRRQSVTVSCLCSFFPNRRATPPNALRRCRSLTMDSMGSLPWVG